MKLISLFLQVGLTGSVNGQWWLDNVGHVLKEGIFFERVASRQLAGLLIGAWYSMFVFLCVCNCSLSANSNQAKETRRTLSALYASLTRHPHR